MRCTVSFPDDLCKAPFDGSTPIIVYGPGCLKPSPDGGSQLGTLLGCAPRAKVTLPAGVGSDAFLTNWVKTSWGAPPAIEATKTTGAHANAVMRRHYKLQ